MRTRRLAWALAIPVVVGLVVGLTAAVVETDRERMIASLERLAADLEAGNVDVLAETLDEKIVVDLGEYGGRSLDKALAIKAAEKALDEYQVTRIRLTNETVEMGPRPVMEVTTVVVSDIPGIGGRPMPLRWRIHWIQRDGEWRILEIERPRTGLGN